MKNILSYFLLAASLLLLISCVYAQDKIIFTNSKEIKDIKVIDVNGEVITYEKTKSPGNQKRLFTDKVFSVKYADGKEKIIYNPDTSMGELAVERQRMFINGTREAREKYSEFTAYIIGFGFGVVGPWLGGISFPVLTPFPPATGVFISSLMSPKMTNQPVDKKYFNNEEFLMGYQKKARGIKTRHALFGALTGIAAGLYMFNIVR